MKDLRPQLYYLLREAPLPLRGVGRKAGGVVDLTARTESGEVRGG